jgi:hypothetical protein
MILFSGPFLMKWREIYSIFIGLNFLIAKSLKRKRIIL